MRPYCKAVVSRSASLFRHLEKMKFMESQLQILTQDLMTRTAATAPKKTQTLDNIVHKTNLKLGGLNFELRLESKEYLFIFYFFYIFYFFLGGGGGGSLHSICLCYFRAQDWIMRSKRLVIGLDITFTGSMREKSIRCPSVLGVGFDVPYFSSSLNVFWFSGFHPTRFHFELWPLSKWCTTLVCCKLSPTPIRFYWWIRIWLDCEGGGCVIFFAVLTSDTLQVEVVFSSV